VNTRVKQELPELYRLQGAAVADDAELCETASAISDVASIAAALRGPNRGDSPEVSGGKNYVARALAAGQSAETVRECMMRAGYPARVAEAVSWLACPRRRQELARREREAALLAINVSAIVTGFIFENFPSRCERSYWNVVRAKEAQ